MVLHLKNWYIIQIIKRRIFVYKLPHFSESESLSYQIYDSRGKVMVLKIMQILQMFLMLINIFASFGRVWWATQEQRNLMCPGWKSWFFFSKDDKFEIDEEIHLSSCENLADITENIFLELEQLERNSKHIFTNNLCLKCALILKFLNELYLFRLKISLYLKKCSINEPLLKILNMFSAVPSDLFYQPWLP